MIRAADLIYKGAYQIDAKADALGFTPSWTGLFRGYVFSCDGLKNHIRVFRLPEAAPQLGDVTQAPRIEAVLDLGPIWQKANHVRRDALPPFNLIPSLQDPEVHDGQYRAQSLWYDDKQQLLGFCISPWYAHGWMPGGGGYPTLIYFDVRPMVQRDVETDALTRTGNPPIAYGPFRWDVTDQCASQVVGHVPADLQRELDQHPEVAGPGPHLFMVGMERSGVHLGSWGPGLTVVQRPSRSTPACDLRVMAGRDRDHPELSPEEAAWPMLRAALLVHHPIKKLYLNEPNVKRPEIRGVGPLPSPWRFRDGRIVYDPTGPLTESTWEIIFGGRHQSWASWLQRPYYRYRPDGAVYGPTLPMEDGRPTNEYFPDIPAWLDLEKQPLPPVLGGWRGSMPWNMDGNRHNYAVLLSASGGRRALLVQTAAYLGARWYGDPSEFLTTEDDVEETVSPLPAWVVTLAPGQTALSDAAQSVEDTNILGLTLAGTGRAAITVEVSDDDGVTWQDWVVDCPGRHEPYVFDGALGTARYGHGAPDAGVWWRVRVTAETACDVRVVRRQWARGGPASEQFASRYFPGELVWDRSYGGRGHGEEARFMVASFLPVDAATVRGETPRATYSDEVHAAAQWPDLVCDETSVPWGERQPPMPGTKQLDLKVQIMGGYQRGRRLYLLQNDAYCDASRTKSFAAVNVWEVR